MKKTFYAIVILNAIMLTACGGSSKGGAECDSLQCDSVNIMPSAAIDTFTSVQEEVVHESKVQEALDNDQEKVNEVAAKAEEKETTVAKETKEPTLNLVQNTSSKSTDKAENLTLTGIWIMQVTDVYNMANEKIESEKQEGISWEFTESTVTVHDEDDYLNGVAVPYTLTGKKLEVKDLIINFTVIKLTDTKLVLRSSPYNDTYNIFTFKRKG